MSDEYLWDGSGAPDPQVQRLEALLGALAYDAPLATVPLAPARSTRARATAFAVAAVVVLGVGIALWVWRGGDQAPQATALGSTVDAGAAPHLATACAAPGEPSWAVTAVAGAPSCAAGATMQPVGAVGAAARLAVGRWLETDAQSVASIEVANIGTVLMEPASRLRVVRTTADEHRLELARGTIHASIDAPPRLFVVDTPVATAIDLGCEYTLTVDDDGGSTLHVTSGYVALDYRERETFVPAGVKARTRPDTGPGVPFAADASEEYVAALDAAASGIGSARAFRAMLAASRERDTISLWHLLPRVRDGRRAAVVDRLTALAPPPDRVRRAALVAGDAAALDAWRGVLEPLWLEGAFGPEQPFEAPAERPGTRLQPAPGTWQ